MHVQQTATKHYQQGITYHDKGKLANAERAYKKAIKIDKRFAEAHSNLGNVYLDQGRLKEASNAYLKALKLLPDHPVILNNIGNVLQLQGENEKSLSWFDKAISQNSKHVDAYCNLGNALRALERNSEASAAYRHALEINPERAEAHYNLGIVLVELDNLNDAVMYFNRALEINPADKNAYLALGKAHNELGNLEQAMSAFRKAIAIDPDNENFHGELGAALSDHGEIEEAVAAQRKALEINPEYTKAYSRLSMNKKFTEHDEDMKAMESLLSKKGILDKDIVPLAFGLGKAYEDLGSYEQSMECVIKGAGIKRNSYEYSISESQQQFDRIKEVFSPDFFAGHGDCGNPDRAPIFILGMPRSGTSLVEQILASHPDVYGAGELKDLWLVLKSIGLSADEGASRIVPKRFLELDAGALADLGKQYMARIREHSAKAKFITNKMPQNFMYVGFIRTILPNARVIHCIRDPMDNCLSIFKNPLPNDHGYANNMSELGQYYRMYQDLMDYWKDTLPGFVYDQRYEDLVKSVEEQVSSLLQYCGLEWDDACLEFHKTRRKVRTASNVQVRRPIYNDSVQLWKRYEKQLEPLRAAIYE
jgi:tetratricopeptide (TPR) repeat protein